MYKKKTDVMWGAIIRKPENLRNYYTEEEDDDDDDDDVYLTLVYLYLLVITYNQCASIFTQKANAIINHSLHIIAHKQSSSFS